jgi:hypothetical protein
MLQIWRFQCRRENKINMDVKQNMRVLNGFMFNLLDSCEHGNEPLLFTKKMELC